MKIVGMTNSQNKKLVSVDMAINFFFLFWLYVTSSIFIQKVTVEIKLTQYWKVVAALEFFLGWLLTKFNKETIWIYQHYKKNYANTWNITIFCINKENKKKNRPIKDIVQIENTDMRIIK